MGEVITNHTHRDYITKETGGGLESYLNISISIEKQIVSLANETTNPEVLFAGLT